MKLDLTFHNLLLDVQRNLPTTDIQNLFAKALPTADGDIDTAAISEFAMKAYDDGSPEMLDGIEFIKAAIELNAIPA